MIVVGVLRGLPNCCCWMLEPHSIRNVVLMLRSLSSAKPLKISDSLPRHIFLRGHHEDLFTLFRSDALIFDETNWNGMSADKLGSTDPP